MKQSLLMLCSLLILITVQSCQDKKKLLSCYLPTKENGEVNINEVSNCIHLEEDGTFGIEKEVLARVVFHGSSKTTAYIGKECYWLRQDGLLRKSPCYDNAADDFVEGLARYKDNKDQMGFVNENLDIVIPAKFSFAYPFVQGTTLVCQNCQEIPQEETEHKLIQYEGTWLLIDKNGKVIKTCPPSLQGKNCR